MYPDLFTIPGIGLPISSFGAMLAVAFLVGSWITSIRMGEEGLEPDASTILIYVIVGGIAGSKLYFAVDVHLRTGVPFTDLLFARDGIGLLVLYLLGFGFVFHALQLKLGNHEPKGKFRLNKHIGVFNSI